MTSSARTNEPISPADRARGLRILAEAFEYPHPGLAAQLETAASERGPFPGRGHLGAFIRAVRALPLGEWEELYTQSFDLHSETAPYLGYHVWGDRHARGAFMVELAAAQRHAGVEPEGELPDHLGLVLRYLGTTADDDSEPLPELMRILEPAVGGLAAALEEAFPGSPYTHLLAATKEAVAGIAGRPV